MFKRKLFKRALPIILSVAMVFQSTPATALAAETSAVVETTDAGESQPDGESQTSQADGEDQQPSEEAQTPQESEEQQSSEETQSAQGSEEQQSSEETQSAQGSEEQQVDEELQQADADEELQQSDADAAAQIIIDQERLGEKISEYGLAYSEGVVSKRYDPDNKVFDSFVNNVLKGGKEVVSVKVGGQKNENLNDKLTFQWKKLDAENNPVDLPAGETPKDAGKYRLVLSFAAIDGLCKAAEDVSIDFEVKQVALELNLDKVNQSPEIGTSIADFVKDFKENCALVNPDLAEQLNKDTYVKDIKVVVRDTISGTEITDGETKFEKGKDYSYTVSVELNDTNYTVKDLGVCDIRLKGDIETYMEVTLSGNIEYTYGEEVKFPVAGTDYTVQVLYDDEDGKAVDIGASADSITAKWLDADGNEIESPSDAGTYYVLLTYTDGTGRYQECDNRVTPAEGNGMIKTSIPVIINPVSIYIRPSLAKKEYTDGKTAADILHDVTYELLTTKDNTALKAEEFDQKTGWGVSYNTEGRTQYYEPVFELQRAELQLDDEGNPQKDKDGKLVYGRYETVGNSEKLISGEEYKYRIAFTGTKAVYDGNGNKYLAADINDGANSATPNYKVDVSDATLYADANIVEVTITKTNAVIDISKYTECTDGVWKKIFDYKPFYTDRESYKKATVNGSDKGLTYRWYYAHKDEETGKYVPYGKEVYSFQYTYEDGTLREYVSPVEAGTYMLVISYADSAHEQAAENAELIYVIEPQKVAPEVATGTEGNKVTAYSGTSIGGFAEKLAAEFTKTIKKAENNDLNSLTDDEILGLWEYGEQYELIPFVERQDNIDSSVWKAVDNSETFLEGGQYRIAYGADILSCDEPIGDLFVRNYQSYDDVETEGGTEREYYLSNYVYVTVDKMGTTPLELRIDAIGTVTKVYDGTPFAIPTEAIKVYNKNTGELVTDIALEYRWYDAEFNEMVGTAQAVNGGKYTLYASFSGNAVYAPLGETVIGEEEGFEITKRAISVTPRVLSKIEAGSYSGDFNKIVQTAMDEEGSTVYLLEVTGNILNTETISDLPAFSYGRWYEDGELHISYKAFESCELTVKQADGTIDPDRVLKAGKDYYVEVSRVGLRTPYNRNYEVTNGRAEFTPVRVGALVSKTESGGIPETSLKDFMGNDAEDSRVIAHTIVPREGIPYVLAKNSGITDDKGKSVGGNLFVFQIQAPKEFFRNGSVGYCNSTDSFNPVFENEVKSNGGYVITEETMAKMTGYVVVAFRTEGKDEKPSFTVRWSDGYTEKFTVDFTGAVLEDDLTKAVAPKSLAFNAPVTKMVVGEKQQLDVKVTKAKLDDIICLKYEVAEENSTVLSVSETGAVVALDKGSATVKAIPCYLDEDGVKQPIEGAKVATAKISVIDVTAPKIKAVTALDTTATVTYPKLTDGYRREVYVLADPKAKEQDFTDAINNLKNGDWRSAGFALAPIYTSVEEYSDKTKLCSVELEGLTANSQYTVYVRNVSGIRELADGSCVAASAKGAVKSFKTTASQLFDMQIRFDEKYWDAYWPDEFYDYEKGTGAYVVDISEKKIPSLTVGMFWENAKNTSANRNDVIEYPLPLDKAELAYYAQPKLSYFAVYGIRSYSEPTSTYTLKIGNRYYCPSNIAKVDKKGNVTLTGQGWVYLIVYDSVTGKMGSGKLYVSAEATKMTIAKSAKVRVGEPLHLEDYVTYYADKQKLTNYNGSNLRITNVEGDVDSFDFARNMEYDSADYVRYIVANEPKKSITLEVTDISMESENVGTITITSKDIEAVKNLKVTEVVDKYATVSFTYPYSAYELEDDSETNETINQLYFRIRILDAAKNVISDKYYNYSDFNNKTYDSKKKIYTLTKYIGLDRPLNRKSSYTVSVTATYRKNEVTSKAVSKSFKTTDIPAAYQAEYDGPFWVYSTKSDSAYKTDDGGIDIAVGNSRELSSYPVLTSNNTYTLVAWPQNNEAKSRLSDTLTWKSTDTKVATVKANAGSYTATLKTLKKGTTKIELTSKITKKIIARWTVFVNATGEASYYFGDWEPDEDMTLVGGVEYGEIELLTLDNPVKARLEVGEGKVAKFVAPEYGSYSFSSENGQMQVYSLDVDGKFKEETYLVYQTADEELRKGEVRYIRVINAGAKAKTVTITADGTQYDIWSGVGEYTLKNGGSIAFTAPEDNYYTVEDSTGEVVRTIGAMKAGETKVIYLSAGTYTVTKRVITESFDEKGLTKQSIEGKTTKWYVFAPTYDMEFTLGLSGKGLAMAVYEDITSARPEESGAEVKVSLKSGEKRYVSVTNNSSDTVETDITVDAKAERADINTPKSVVLKAEDEGIYVQYKIPADGWYRFTTSATKVDADQKTVPADVNVYFGISTDSCDESMELEEEMRFAKDDIVYVYVESWEATAENNVTVTINVTPFDAKVIEVGETAGEKLSSSSYNYYKFTAKADGEYTFKADITKRAGEDAVTPSAEISYYQGKTFDVNDFGSPRYNSFTVTLENGAVVYLRVKTDDSEENKQDDAKIIVSRLEVTASFTDEWKGTLKEGETKWLQFKASQDTIYNITSKDNRTEDGKGAVTVEVASRLSSDASVSSIDSASKAYKAGDTIYLKLEATNGDAECTVTAVPVETKKAPAANVIITKGTEQYFAYTANTKARYRVEVTGEGAASVSVSKSTSLTNYFSSVGVTSEITLKAGETVYYKITNNTDKDQTVSLDIQPIAYDKLTTSATADVKENNSVWYSFTADAAGRYSFNADAKAAEGKTAYAAITYYTDALGDTPITGVDYNPEKAVFVKANETIYICVKVTGADASVTTSVKKIAAKDITAVAGTPVTVTEENLAQNSYVWYEIKGEGIYTIDISDATGAYSTYGVCNNDTYGSIPATITLGSADVYTIAIRADADKLGYKLTSTKRDVKDLTLTTPVPGSIKTGENLYVSFKTPETGRYAVWLDGLKDGVSPTMQVTGGTNGFTTNGSYSSFVSNINDTVTFTINVTSEEAVSFNVKAELVNASDITANGTALVKVAETPAGYVNWYSYTAAETGKYIAKVSDANAVVYRSAGSAPQLTDGFNSSFKLIELTLNKGVTYYYAVYYTAKPEADVTFSITKAAANKLDKDYAVDVSKLLANEKTYISFTAPADGRYVFTCDNAAITSASIYENVDELSYYNTLTFGTDRPMREGEELVFAVAASPVPDKNFTISVSSIEFKPLEISQEVKAELTGSDSLWISFTAAETAKYKFDMTNVSGAYMYKELTDQNYSYYIFDSDSYGVDNGQTVYLKLTPDSAQVDESGKVAVSIKVSVDVKMTGLSESANELKDIADGDTWVYFTAETAGFYTFAVEGDCTVYAYTDVNAYGYTQIDDTYTSALGKGDSLYLRIGNNTGDVAAETITVTRTKDINELAIGVTNGAQTDENNYAYYVITAPETGMYYITASMSNGSTGSLRVYDSAKDIDSYYNYSTSNVLSLKKDEVKYIRIYTGGWDCDVRCTKVAEEVLTSDKPLSMTMNKGDSVLVKWTAESEGYYRFKFSSNESYTVNGSTLVYAKSGEVIERRITVYKDDTTVKMSVEALNYKMISGEGLSNLGSLKQDNAMLVIWTSDGSGSYHFDVQPETIRCTYYPYGLEGSSDFYNSWSVVKGNKMYVLLEAYSTAKNVTIDVQKEVKELTVNSYISSTLAANDSEQFTFTATEANYYLFCSEGASLVDGELAVVGNNARSATYSYGTDGNFYIKRYLEAGQTATLTVRNLANSTRTITVKLYTLSEVDGGSLDSDTDNYRSWECEYGQEKWFNFTVSESGWYQFSSDYNRIRMKLYADDMDGEVLYYEDTSIRVWLDENDKVLLRTWGTDHNYAYDYLNIASVRIEDASRYGNISNDGSTNVSVDMAQRAVINYTYSNSNADVSSVTLRFSNNNNLHMALYLDDEYIAESDNGVLEQQVSSDNFNSIKLIVWSDQYQAFSAYVYYSIVDVEYSDITDVAIDGETEVYVPQNDKRVVTYKSISEAGKYVFYSTDSVTATVYNNDTEQTINNEADGTGFQYTLDLAAGDKVKFELNNNYAAQTISLSGYKVEAESDSDTDTLSGSEETKTKNISVSEHAIKTVTYTVGKAGTYTFKLSATGEDIASYKFELTVGETTYSDWDTSTDEIELKENDEVTVTLWNADKYASALAQLEVTYQAPGEEGGEPENPETPETTPGEGGTGGSGETDGNDGNDDSTN